MQPVIKRLEETEFTFRDIVDLIHLSFEERLDQGLNFTCSFITPEQYQEKMQGGIVLVAIDPETGELLGTAATRIRTNAKQQKYGYNEYLAIHPSAKRKGIGSMLLRKRIEILTSAGVNYILSHTADRARSSVAYHKKNGFHAVELFSFEDTNYYSILFRLQVSEDSFIDKAYKSSFLCGIHFFISCVKTKSLKKRDGTATAFGRLLDSIKRSY